MNIFVSNAKRFALLTVTSLVVFSCSKDEQDALEQEQEQKVTQTELKTILETDDISSVADTVVADLFNDSSSNKSAKNDECYEATYSDTGFTVTFPNCTDEESGETLNGTLSVIYGAESDNYAFAVTFDDFMVGEISINGTRSFNISGSEQQDSVIFNIASDMSITMADDAVVSEEGSKTFAIVFGEQFGEGTFTLDGEWTIKAEGNTYSVDVTELLSTDFGCDYIGKGLMLLNKNGLEVSVDFGDGSCDDMASVIYPDGTKESYTLDK